MFFSQSEITDINIYVYYRKINFRNIVFFLWNFATYVYLWLLFVVIRHLTIVFASFGSKTKTADSCSLFDAVARQNSQFKTDLSLHHKLVLNCICNISKLKCDAFVINQSTITSKQIIFGDCDLFVPECLSF